MGKIGLSRRHVGGFTLVEIVVVAGIMALFSLTLIGIFLATIRSGGKSQLAQAVHQEGDFALKRIGSTIRSSQAVSCAGDEINVTTSSGAEIIFSLVADGGLTRVASDSSNFLTGKLAEAGSLNFSCYQGTLGNQVVTISFELNTHPLSSGQVQEQFQQEFATSVSTRQY